MTRSTTRTLLILTAAVTASAATGAALTQRWWLFTGCLLTLTMIGLHVWSSTTAATRAARSADAVSDWTPERVNSLLAPDVDTVQAVRELRSADPRLSLADALTVARTRATD